jgi:hypothetical protein|tara:strand:+ start:187 stop:462 length:276 start_codon:yes stop_codon:yes gene_type:complete
VTILPQLVAGAHFRIILSTLGHSIRVLPDKLHVLKKNMKKKCLYVQNIKKKDIPTLIIDFSGHFSGHFILKGHYIMSKAVVPSRARKAVNV